MSFGSPPPENPYGHPQQGQQGQQGLPGYPQQGGQPGYGYPQQGGQPGYGYPQQGGQPGYGYPQQPGYPGGPGPRVASMGRRLGARLIDGVIIGIVYIVLLIAGVAGSFGAAQDCDVNSPAYESCVDDAAADMMGPLTAVFLILGIASLLYEWLMVGLVGATLGKMLLGMRVVKADTGQKTGLGSSFIRWIIPIVGSLACGIGQLLVYLSPFWDKSGRQQGWHDKAASTMVVQR
ncbi:RDD family protein [Streptomyces sp. NPDC052020]|uniref:RDD family protein n=1 Tax=Streptomyces sp. NPDC052020 TaxID=3155677 RepID=UPI003438AD2E